MKKILVPVDFTSLTEPAVTHAIGIASVTGAEIILLHSFYDQIYFTDGGFGSGFESNVLVSEDIISEFYNQKKQALEELRTTVQDRVAKDCRVTAEMANGNPEFRILELIEQFKVDLVIMGSSDIGKKGPIGGSVAKAVVDRAACPVMVIPESRKYTSFANIVYMTEFQLEDANMIDKLFSLFNNFNFHLHILHLLPKGEKNDANRRMRKITDNEYIASHIGMIGSHILECEDLQNSLESFVQEKKIDLITFIPHKRSAFRAWFTSDLTKRDLFQTHIPILGMR